MKAVIRRGGAQLVCEEVADPTPGAGHVLLRTLVCGICGSDLHALDHLPRICELRRRVGSGVVMDPAKDLVFGHEFCGEVVDYGPGVEKKFKTGARVIAFPRATGPNGAETVGFSNRFPGGYGEFVCVDEAMLLAAPDNLTDAQAAMTEPFAVGAHAVERARLDADSVCVVVGCGAVGLAVIAALKAKGFGPVIATDFSPMRRKAAETIGADVVIDPAQHSPFDRWEEFGVALSGAARDKAMLAGKRAKDAVIFECVGAPGMIQKIVDGAAPAAQVIVVGVCMEEDRFEPYSALTKQLSLIFSSSYTFAEFSQTLERIAAGRIDVAPMITGVVGRADVTQAFKDLARPDAHVKIVIDARL